VDSFPAHGSCQILRLKKTEETSRSDDLVQVTRAAMKEIPSDLNTNDVTASGE